MQEFLRAFRADSADPLTDPRLLSDYIDARAGSELKEWDVLFASAQKDGVKREQLASQVMKPFDRSVSDEDLQNRILAISGTSRRVGSPGDEKEGVGAEEEICAEVEFRREFPDRSVPNPLPDRFFRITRSRALLIIRFVTPKSVKLQQDLPDDNVLAWTISFPQSHIAGGTVEYVVNTIRMREMFGELEIEEEALGDTE